MQITRNGWTRPDPFSATIDVIAPLAFGLMGMILLPPALLWGSRKVVDLPIDDDFLCERILILVHRAILIPNFVAVLYMYPVIFTQVAVVHGLLSLSEVVSSWSQIIRDKEFLVEMRLRNLESDVESDEVDKDSKSDINLDEDDGLEEDQF